MIENRRRARVRMLTTAAIAFGLAATSAWAQDATSQGASGAEPTTGNDIVVTARRKSERLQDVPVAVTALSGSGPAYVFYFIEAMEAAGTAMGLSAEQARQLAIGTFVGASELARASSEPPSILRERVTSKGGTTYAALTSMEEDHLKTRFMKALDMARARAVELGDEFGKA